MTLVGAVVQDDQAYLYADSGIFDPETGVLLGTGHKLQKCTRFPAAVGITFHGPPQALSCLAGLEAHDADGLFERLPRVIATFRRKARKLGCASPSMRLVTIAWDEKQRRPRIFVCGDGLDVFGVAADDAREAEGYFFGAATNDIAAHWTGGSPTDPEHFHPVHGARALFNTARDQPFVQLGGTRTGHFIGGQLHCMELSEYSVDLYQLHDWGDDVGARI